MMDVKFYPMGAGVVCGTTMRGVSGSHAGPYEGLSVCGYTGDEEVHVRASLESLARLLGVRPEDIVMPRQTHSATVRRIGRWISQGELYGVDGLVTTEPGIVIGMNTADCVPVLLADSRARVVAAVHAGWRGAVAGIVMKAVDEMTEAGASAENIRAYIGPSIHSCCFEVGQEVAREFPKRFVIRAGGAKPHVDLQGFVTWQLTQKGVPAENIEDSGECTRCRPERYFSARALGINSGRNFSFIGLR